MANRKPEALMIVQARGGGSWDGDVLEGVLTSGWTEFMLKVKLMDLADGLCVECGKRGIQDDFRDFGLSSWINEVAIY